MSIAFKPCDAVIGAEVEGVSLAQVPDAAGMAAIEQGLEKYGVLVFRDQAITPRQQVDFSRAFAPLELTEVENARLDGVEEIFVVGNSGEKPVTFAPSSTDGELEWHTDHIHRPVPARASLLHALSVPASGGDTLFACMYSAYDALSETQKSEYDRLEVVNSVSGLLDWLHRQGHEDVKQDRDGESPAQVVWPLVRAHPVSGRKALYFGNQVSIGVVGRSDEESRRFVEDLTAHACRPAFRYRHVWRVGDAVLWDNRRVLHAGTPYDLAREKRLMHRTTLRETEPIELVGAQT
jgi:alpha-ketoglutarate-dependent taurine dioxygenase